MPGGSQEGNQKEVTAELRKEGGKAERSPKSHSSLGSLTSHVPAGGVPSAPPTPSTRACHCAGCAQPPNPGEPHRSPALQSQALHPPTPPRKAASCLAAGSAHTTGGSFMSSAKDQIQRIWPKKVMLTPPPPPYLPDHLGKPRERLAGRVWPSLQGFLDVPKILPTSPASRGQAGGGRGAEQLGTAWAPVDRCSSVYFL